MYTHLATSRHPERDPIRFWMGLNEGPPYFASIGVWLRVSAVLFVFSSVTHAQQPIGTVITENATVSGLVSISSQQATINNQGTITAATNRTAELHLTRGGTARVCSTSTLHVSQSNADTPPLLLALDRGALELAFPATTSDALITPDLRFQLTSSGQLDLQIRVATNGDTCVDNRSKAGPTLHVTSQFGPEGYFVKPGQHLLFEHASLLKVVDTETTSCGCPPPMPATNPGAPSSPAASSLAKVGLDHPVTPAEAAAANPFPEAQSAGLAPMPEVPQAATGQVNTQITETFSTNGTPSKPASTDSSQAKVTEAQTTLPPPPARKSNPFTAIGHFFKHIFGGS